MAVQTIEPAVNVPPKLNMTFEEFLDWCDEDTYAEWVDGEVHVYSAPNKEEFPVTSPASQKHQQVGSFLETLLHLYTQQHKQGLVLRAPFSMRLPDLNRAREPDILFVASARSHLIHNTFLDGAADLVIEIVSPESIRRDRADKFIEYESAGVKEYWLIDPDRQVAEFYQLGDDGRYRPAALAADGIYRSQVIAGFWLRVAWLWQTPLPSTLDILRELKII